MRRAGLYLYRVRLGLDVSLAEVERLSGYSAALISAIECGRRSLTPECQEVLVRSYDKILRQCLAAGREVGLARPADMPGKGRRRRAA